MSIVVHLPEWAEKQLGEIAEQTGKTKEELAKDVLLDELEDIALTKERLGEFLDSGEKSISLEDLDRKLGFGDR